MSDLEKKPQEVRQAHDYLRRVFEHCAPGRQALPDLMGVCAQIDNLIAGYRMRLSAAPMTFQPPKPVGKVIPDEPPAERAITQSEFVDWAQFRLAELTELTDQRYRAGVQETIRGVLYELFGVTTCRFRTETTMHITPES